MADSFALQTLRLASSTAREKFERLFETEILPTSADTGPVDRGGESIIASQHLLRLGGESLEYLWVTKWSGAFTIDKFSREMERMSQVAAARLQGICQGTPMVVWTQVHSYDAGPRDTLGRPTGPPRRDVAL